MTDPTNSLIGFLAQRGLAFIEGIPPMTEDGTLLVWNGGCNALVVRWDKNELITWDDLMPLVQSDIVCWMRLPHPSIWPMVKTPAMLIPERDLYSANADVLTTFEEQNK